MELIFWTVFIVAACLTLTRVPRLSNSRNQVIFVCGIALTISFALMLPPIYTAIDSLFFHPNFTDLFAKLSLFLAVNILSGQLAKLLRNKRAAKWTVGFPGRIILVLAYAALLAIFAFTDAPESSPGLGAYANDPVPLAYNTLACAYLAYLAACLVGPLLMDIRTASDKTRRAASSLLLAGFFLVIIRAVMMPLSPLAPGLYGTGQAVSAVSALFVIAGLTLAWIAFRQQPRGTIIQSFLRT